MKKPSFWWSGVFLAVATTQAGAQNGATTGNDELASKPDLAAVQALAPVMVQGQILATELPEGSTITARQQLDERSIESWEDFSKRGEPGVSFSTTNNSINIRGMDQDRVVTRVDGIRIPWLNDAARGEKGGLSTINFNSLSSIDLVRAAGSTQSGSLVGYLNLRTLSPDDLLSGDQRFGALIKSGYDSADNSWGVDAALAGLIGETNTSWLVQAGQRRGHELENKGQIGGYGLERDKSNPESYTQRNLMVKLQHDFNTEHRLTASGELYKRTNTIDSLHDQGPDSSFYLGANKTNEEASRKRVMLGYEFWAMDDKAAVSHGDIKLYWQRSFQANAQNAIRVPDGRGEISFGPNFPVGQIYGYAYPYGPYGRDNSIQETGHGVLTSWEGYISSGPIQNHWAIGGEWYSNSVEQNTSGYDNCPDNLLSNPFANTFGPRNCDLLHTNQSDAPKANGNQWSAWAQNEISWADGKYALTPSLRFDAYKFTPKADQAYEANPNAEVTTLTSNSGQRVSPSLLAAYRPRTDLSFYAKYGYGYKAPNAAQLYTNYGAPSTYLRVGNPNLKAEQSRGWELGINAGDNNLGGQLSLFDNRYRDFIEEGLSLTPNSPEWNPAWTGVYPMGVTGTANRSRVRIYGAELSGHWRIDNNWYTRGSMAWARGKDQHTNRYLNSVAPLKAIMALGYQTNQWGVEAITTLAQRRKNVEYADADPANGINTADFKAPGYGLLDLNAWWKPQAVKGLQLQAGIYNTFDKKYWNALDVPRLGGRGSRPIDYYTQPGRSFRVNLTYQY